VLAPHPPATYRDDHDPKRPGRSNKPVDIPIKQMAPFLAASLKASRGLRPIPDIRIPQVQGLASFVCEIHGGFRFVVLK
jgi:hypothetical protein